MKSLPLLFSGLLFLTATVLFGNSFDFNFEGKQMTEPSAELLQEIDGEQFAFIFTKKGDGGQFYLSPKSGKDHSSGLVATSLSVGSDEAEEIIVRRADSKAFTFSGIYIKPSGEAVVITPMLNGKDIGESFTVSRSSSGKDIYFNNLKVDAVKISSRDMLQLVIDNFRGSSVNKVNPDLLDNIKETQTAETKKLNKVYAQVAIAENPSVNDLVASINISGIAKDFNIDINDVIIDINAGNEASENGLSPFYFSSDKTAIRVLDPLQFDCERKDDFEIEFSASDMQGLIKRDFSITVSLIEQNDEVPEIAFNQSCSITAKSKINGSIELCAISVKDKDTDLGSLNNWRIEKSDIPLDLISINERGAIIIRDANLLVEKGSRNYKVWLSVSDGVNRSLKTAISINVKGAVKIIKHWPEVLEETLTQEEEVSNNREEEQNLIDLNAGTMSKISSISKAEIKKSPVDTVVLAPAENKKIIKSDSLENVNLTWLSQVII